LFSRTPYLRRLAVGLLAALVLGGNSWAAGSGDVPVFSGARAMGHLTAQTDLGPRPPGSEALGELRLMITELAQAQGLRAVTLCFDSVDPQTGDPVEICNIVVQAGPEGGDRLWLGAHYDTRPVSDQDPDPDRRTVPVIGANDGASGVAVLMHLMEIMGEKPPAEGVDLLFFDGEDSGVSGNPRSFCLGSARLAATWQDFGNPLATGTPTGLVVLDMVGRKGLTIRQEAYSLEASRDWTLAVFARANDLGLTAFVPERGTAVFDDHIPFIEAGIPAVDLIDFEFPEWHTTADVPAACSPESLEQVGRLVTDLVYHW
jgi:glutaminyl-peptide cyclotransferase